MTKKTQKKDYYQTTILEGYKSFYYYRYVRNDSPSDFVEYCLWYAPYLDTEHKRGIYDCYKKPSKTKIDIWLAINRPRHKGIEIVLYVTIIKYNTYYFTACRLLYDTISEMFIFEKITPTTLYRTYITRKTPLVHDMTTRAFKEKLKGK